MSWERVCMEIASCGMHRVNKSGVGTWGAFVGLLIQSVLVWLGASFWEMLWVTLGVTIVALVVTRPAERLMLRIYGRRKRHNGKLVEYDFNQDCLDETAGQLWAGLFILLSDMPWWSMIIGFVLAFGLFRLFDIWKPGFIGYIEKKFPAGSAWGIVLDDVAAGILTWPILFFIYFIIMM